MKKVHGSKLPWVAASHEDIKRPGVLKKVLFDKSELFSGQAQMVNWAKLPVGERFKRHYHEDMQEIFVVVSGKVEMIVQDESCELERGDAIVVLPNQVHQMINIADEPCEYIVMGISLGKAGKTVVVE